jgi:hypothetical protein
MMPRGLGGDRVCVGDHAGVVVVLFGTIVVSVDDLPRVLFIIHPGDEVAEDGGSDFCSMP